jgi:hypothetical protein
LTFKNWIAVAIVFGIVAAAVVWWLERFEVNRFHGEVKQYLNNQQLFEEWLRERGPNVG